jgi:DNA-directed RNA polymerase specialized sigma24 family protein
MRPSMPLDENQRMLAADHFRIALSVALKLSTSCPSRRDDMISDAMLELCHAARRWRPDNPHAFGKCIRKPILWRIACPRKLPPPTTSLDSVIPDRAVSHEAVYDANEAAEAILKGLPPKVARALRLIALEGMSWPEAAREMGCSVAEIHRLRVLARTLMGDSNKCH